jgi:hypothetical protein
VALGLFGVLVLGTSGIAQAQPQEIGQWETRPEFMPINPVHTGLLRTGKVLVIAGSGNDPGEPVYKATVWDPVGGTIDRVRELPWASGATACLFSPTAGHSSRVAANPSRPTISRACGTPRYSIPRPRSLPGSRTWPTAVGIPPTSPCPTAGPPRFRAATTRPVTPTRRSRSTPSAAAGARNAR